MAAVSSKATILPPENTRLPSLFFGSTVVSLKEVIVLSGKALVEKNIQEIYSTGTIQIDTRNMTKPLHLREVVAIRNVHIYQAQPDDEPTNRVSEVVIDYLSCSSFTYKDLPDYSISTEVRSSPYFSLDDQNDGTSLSLLRKTRMPTRDQVTQYHQLIGCIMDVVRAQKEAYEKFQSSSPDSVQKILTERKKNSIKKHGDTSRLYISCFIRRGKTVEFRSGMDYSLIVASGAATLPAEPRSSSSNSVSVPSASTKGKGLISSSSQDKPKPNKLTTTIFYYKEFLAPDPDERLKIEHLVEYDETDNSTLSTLIRWLLRDRSGDPIPPFIDACILLGANLSRWNQTKTIRQHLKRRNELNQLFLSKKFDIDQIKKLLEEKNFIPNIGQYLAHFHVLEQNANSSRPKAQDKDYETLNNHVEIDSCDELKRSKHLFYQWIQVLRENFDDAAKALLKKKDLLKEIEKLESKASSECKENASNQSSDNSDENLLIRFIRAYPLKQSKLLVFEIKRLFQNSKKMDGNSN